MTPHFSSGPTPFSRSAQFFFVAVGLTAGFLFILLRMLVIQGVQYDKWHHLAARQHERKISAHVERGTIYDRYGKILAINVDVPSLYAVPERMTRIGETARLLAPLLKMDQNALVRKFRRRQGFIWLARKMDPDVANKIKALNLPGVGFLVESKRFYPKGALFGHIVGFTGIDDQGMEGIEHRYEDWLRGEAGEVVVVRDAYGQSIYPKGFNYIPPARGADLYLTLDETMQHIASRELRRAVTRTQAKRGVAIVMDPRDGAILAMVMDPPFDPNAWKRYRPPDWRNRAITDMYEPGSTFKVITAAGALETGLVTPEEIIDCEGGAMAISGTVIHDAHPVGKVPFRDVLAQSSNIGMIKVADRLGPVRLAAFSQSFGFGSGRGIDLTGESSGMLRDPRQWSERSLASIAMGQEVAVTPLQMTVAVSAIANGGWRVTPHIRRTGAEQEKGVLPVKVESRPSNASSAVLINNPVRPNRAQQVRVISQKTAKTMTALLQHTVEAGTGKRAAIFGFDVAGKTGTAQKVNPETGRYAEKQYMSSFVGFVPTDHPRLTIYVMLDEPEKDTYGGEAAAPAFSAIGREVLHYLKIPPNAPKQLEKT